MAQDPIIGLIVQGARQRGLDPNAVLAVARQEGLSGRVGDQGTSFGPFQLHIGGALPRGISNPQAWAMSPAGINYALDQIAGVARGKRGAAAINAIVRGFERPADPNSEVARALGGYSGAQGSLPVPLGGLPAAQNTRSAGLDPLLLGVLRQNGLGPNISSLLQPAAEAPTVPQTAPQAAQTTVPYKRGTTIRWLEHFASPFGVQVTSTTQGKHVRGSYHYRGRAVDFAGSPQQMQALAEAALAHPQDFKEVFFDPMGVYVKDGRVYRGSIGGHSDHVHLAR